MRLGIIDMIGLAATLIFALPVANFGVTKLLAGEVTMGIALVVVAVAMVVIPHYFMDPRTVFTKLLKGVLPSRLRGEGSTVESENRPEQES
jgi:hypothetical protein